MSKIFSVEGFMSLEYAERAHFCHFVVAGAEAGLSDDPERGLGTSPEPSRRAQWALILKIWMPMDRRNALFSLCFFGLLAALGTSLKALALPQQTALTLRNESFVSPAFSQETQRQYQFVDFEIDQVFAFRDSSFLVGLDAGLELSTQQSALHRLKAREVYLQREGFGTTFRWSFGRKIETWNDLDRSWDLGVIEPLDQRNPLDPKNQGLTGLFWGGPLGNEASFITWFSGLHVPHQGPNFRLSEGQFETVNPWFPKFPSSIRLSGSSKVRQILYSVNEPRMDQVVLQPGLMGQLRWGGARGWALNLTGGRKAQNELVMGVDGRAVSDPLAFVEVSPTVAFHSVAGLDLIHHYENGALFEWINSFSFLGDVTEGPQRRESRLTYLVPESSESFALRTEMVWSKHRMALLARSTRGGALRPEGPKEADFANFVDKRFLFQQAAALEYGWRWNSRSEMVTRWTQDLENPASQWDLSAETELGSSWVLRGGLLWVRGAEGASTLLNTLENNDFVYGGIGYVF